MILLPPKKNFGRPPLLTPEELQQTKMAVKGSPKTAGFSLARWIGSRIRDYIGKLFGKHPCLKTVYNYLKRLNIRRLKTRGKFLHAKPEVIAAFKESHTQFVANLQAFEAVVYLDEAGIEFHVRLSYIWAERGKPDEREVWDNSSRERQNIIRAVDPRMTGIWPNSSLREMPST